MQQRMREHPLTTEQIDGLLQTAVVGRLATHGADGYPYVVPVHFVYADGCIYVHGLPVGQKIENLVDNPKVGFETDEMHGLLVDGVKTPCDVNTAYHSVVIRGTAHLLEDHSAKTDILRRVIRKYTPDLADREIGEGMVEATAVIKIEPVLCTGKYYA